jgi:hypothetical protein
MKKITAAASTYCATSTCTNTCTGAGCTTDTATCCVDNAAKCKSFSGSCDANHIKDPAKHGVDGTTKAACCTARAKCTTVTCDAAGTKQIAAHATTYCAGTACTTTCTGTGCTHEKGSLCCETDTTKCKGASVSCGASKYKDSAKWGTAGATVALCCTDRALCSTLPCGAGKKTEDRHLVLRNKDMRHLRCCRHC